MKLKLPNRRKAAWVMVSLEQFGENVWCIEQVRGKDRRVGILALPTDIDIKALEKAQQQEPK